jgi:hypothetical protein
MNTTSPSAAAPKLTRRVRRPNTPIRPGKIVPSASLPDPNTRVGAHARTHEALSVLITASSLSVLITASSFLTADV